MKCPRCGEHLETKQLHMAWRVRAELIDALERNGWNRTRAAKDLGVCLRTVRTWVAQMKEAGFEIKDSTHWRRANDRKTNS